MFRQPNISRHQNSNFTWFHQKALRIYVLFAYLFTNCNYKMERTNIDNISQRYLFESTSGYIHMLICKAPFWFPLSIECFRSGVERICILIKMTLLGHTRRTWLFMALRSHQGNLDWIELLDQIQFFQNWIRYF